MDDRTITYCSILRHWKGEEINNIGMIAEHVDRELKALKPLCDEMRSADEDKRKSIWNSRLADDLRHVFNDEAVLAEALLNYASTAPEAEFNSVKYVYGCNWMYFNEKEGVLL